MVKRAVTLAATVGGMILVTVPTPAQARLSPADAPSAAALADIPPSYLALYTAAAHTCQGLPWQVLAGIGSVESDHGRSTAPDVHGPTGYISAQGPMQFEPATFAEYAVNADRGHPVSPYDPADAIYSAARMLCASGAAGGSQAGLAQAIFAYNHAGWYVNEVLNQAQHYSGAVAQPLPARRPAPTVKPAPAPSAAPAAAEAARPAKPVRPVRPAHRVRPPEPAGSAQPPRPSSSPRTPEPPRSAQSPLPVRSTLPPRAAGTLPTCVPSQARVKDAVASGQFYGSFTVTKDGHYVINVHVIGPAKPDSLPTCTGPGDEQIITGTVPEWAEPPSPDQGAVSPPVPPTLSPAPSETPLPPETPVTPPASASPSPFPSAAATPSLATSPPSPGPS